MEVNLNDLPLDFEAAGHTENFIHIIGNKVVAGYLSNDCDAPNPIEDFDGEGIILQSDHKEHRRKMNSALGLDSDEEPKLSIFANSVVARLTNDEVNEWIEEYVNSSSTPSTRKDLAGALENLDNNHLTSAHWNFVTEVWCEAIEEGSIGNPYAVCLEKYEHSGVSWSVSTIREDKHPDGIWIPDQCAEEEAIRREAVYAFGEVIQPFGQSTYQVKLDDGTLSESFKEWHEAFSWLQSRFENHVPTAKQRRIGQRRASIELANQALDQFNKWLAGDCYGIVCATFENVGDDESPEWEMIESDECWGFVGSDYAEDEVKALAQHKAEKLKEELQSQQSNELALAA